jgi:voltage-gated potassium channel
VTDKDPRQPAPMPDAPVVGGHATTSRRILILGILRSGAILAAALLLYAVLPIETVAAARAVGVLAVVGLLVVAWVFVRQVQRISQSSRPAVAAVEALALVFGLFLTLFASLYLSTDLANPGAFSQPIDKLAGIYFSVTIMATVGFGDIAPLSATARTLVTLQMVLDMILIGTAVKILLETAKRAAGNAPFGGLHTSGTAD